MGHGKSDICDICVFLVHDEPANVFHKVTHLIKYNNCIQPRLTPVLFPVTRVSTGLEAEGGEDCSAVLARLGSTLAHSFPGEKARENVLEV